MDNILFDFWDALLLCGIIQGLVLAALLIIRKSWPPYASYFLVATLLIFAFHNILIISRDSNLSDVYPVIENLPINLILGLGPCIYFYVFFSLHSKYPRPLLMAHFIPVTIQFCYYLALTIKADFHPDYPYWKFISQSEQISTLISVCVYTYMSIQMLQVHRQSNLPLVPKAKPGMLSWLKKLLGAYILLWMVWLVYTFLDIFYFNYRLSLRDYFPLYLLVSVLTYAIGIMAYLRPSVSLAETGNKSFTTKDENDTQKHLKLLKDIMVEEKLYLHPDLKLKHVADKTGIPVNLISYVINNKLGQSFNDWINCFRIEEVKKQITSSRLKEVTLLGIAFECGFNSKATFNRVFKHQTGLTPREFLLQATNK
ncbi:hypothetical protein DYBT9275_01823 [Dyadobacter sp. CECT 9275]|uniref:HTH araC/xylS-type domain-containing protein n=1 Tax=Dyadobacter helix TaxID=2822344 RepID=A0A916JCV1_9BACT|nr:helix-turn-helix domain-containing protein [Dyadobacter sp. CECT 9275]CAG4997647.1 hypothetical protein DYBT9275_01823 [Dyadobacter sp. CECT 9275]